MSAECPVFEFILQPEFPMNAFILGIETLRIANQHDGVTYCNWQITAIDRAPVRATNGMTLIPDFTFDRAPPADYYLVFGGNLPTQVLSEKLLSHLRHAARFGRYVGSVDTGLFALAQAGLLSSDKDNQAVIHWEAAPSFSERYPQIELLDLTYLIRNRLLFCAGGVAILDLMLALLEQMVSPVVADGVAHALIFHRPHANAPQKSDLDRVSSDRNISDRLTDLMENNIESPLCLTEIAGILNLSVRTLERKTFKFFNLSPMRLYLEIRLRAARNLLFYEEHPVNVVGLLCGFSSSSVFTRSFKKRFNMSPNQFRKSYRRVQMKGVG